MNSTNRLVLLLIFIGTFIGSTLTFVVPLFWHLIKPLIHSWTA